MVESSKLRARFRKGEQRKFLVSAETKIGLGKLALARLLGVNSRTFYDWKREKFLIPVKCAELLSLKSGVAIPDFEVRDRYWYTQVGAALGGKSCFEKHGRVGGDEEVRKRKWYEWWRTKGKFSPQAVICAAKKISYPKLSVELAEMVGIILGDGGISNYQLSVTLHRFDDADYSKFVVALLKKLFKVPVSVYEEPGALANNLVVSRIQLVRFLTGAVGLKVGNKVTQQVDVPNWIKKNNEFKKACLRGLVDTDGCLIIHKYQINGKKYIYKKLSFSNCSKPLIDFALETLVSLGIKARRARNGKEVRIDSIECMKMYFSVVGSHNKKHLRRWLK